MSNTICNKERKQEWLCPFIVKPRDSETSFKFHSKCEIHINIPFSLKDIVSCVRLFAVMSLFKGKNELRLSEWGGRMPEEFFKKNKKKKLATLCSPFMLINQPNLNLQSSCSAPQLHTVVLKQELNKLTEILTCFYAKIFQNKKKISDA